MVDTAERRIEIIKYLYIDSQMSGVGTASCGQKLISNYRCKPQKLLRKIVLQLK